MELHGYFRSSASYRVRIALNLKGLHYDYCPVNLLKGEQKGEAYRARNPQGLVPTLAYGDKSLTQSLAIIEWLEEQHPQPALLPSDSFERARIRALAYNVACDIQPIQNLRVLKFLQTEYSVSDEQKAGWVRHWIDQGFAALEQQMSAIPFASGNTPGLFEVCLMPQVYNAERFGVEMSAFPKLQAIAEACSALPAFERARPENQPDSTL